MSHSLCLSVCLSGLADLTDVTLVSDDTFRTLGTWVTHYHLSSVIESNLFSVMIPLEDFTDEDGDDDENDEEENDEDEDDEDEGEDVNDDDEEIQ